MLKKQTVWLLTMLSLMVVLSVYYLNAPKQGDLAFNNEQDNVSTELLDQETNTSGVTDLSEEVDTSSISTDEQFAAVRLEVMNQRSLEKERLESIVASAEATSEEKNIAYEAMKEMEVMESKEAILEDTIKSINGYDHVLVRNVSNNNIVVTVQTDTLSKKEANRIIQQTKDEFGEVNIEVQYKAS
ncbi:SpoIIIAH-like family protein [Gracilibacillus marinus]|uniref:SpoIIIAH-like family protein n=1 Tax=Gracilibacillus marinus TaxID=630535 RepID=A0ABV8VY73_9BACI